MKILLAVDGSPCSNLAVEEIGRRPWPDGSSVKVLNAFELPLPASPEGWALPPNYFDELDQAVRKQAQSIINRALSVHYDHEIRLVIDEGGGTASICTRTFGPMNPPASDRAAFGAGRNVPRKSIGRRVRSI